MSLLVVLSLSLTVPEVWQAGRQMDPQRLQEVHHQARAQLGTQDTPRSRLLVALVDLYRIQRALATGHPETARVALQEARTLLEALPEAERTADLWAFLGNLYGTALALSPWYRLPGLGRQAARALQKALQQDSLNPRVWLFLGIQAFYTPPLFGGGPEKALRRLDRALHLYQQRPLDPFWGRWGEDLALLYRARTLYRLGRSAEALQTLQQCLRRYPDFQEAHHWATTLFPTLEVNP